MNQLARCAYPNCNRPFIKTRPSRIYCSVQCTDKAAHARARKRGKLAVEEYQAHLIAEDQRLAVAAAEELAKLQAQNQPTTAEPPDTFASAIAAMGFEPTQLSSIQEADISEKAYEEQGPTEEQRPTATRSGMPSGTEILTGEQLAAYMHTREEDRLVKLDKENRAQKKRERAIKRAQLLEQGKAPDTIRNILGITDDEDI